MKAIAFTGTTSAARRNQIALFTVVASLAGLYFYRRQGGNVRHFIKTSMSPWIRRIFGARRGTNSAWPTNPVDLDRASAI